MPEKDCQNTAGREEADTSAQIAALEHFAERVTIAPPLDELMLRHLGVYILVWMGFLLLAIANGVVGGPGSDWAQTFLLTLLAVGLLYIPARLWLETRALSRRAVSFHWDRDGITLDRGQAGHHEIPWREIARVDMPRNRMFTRSGRMVSLQALPECWDFGVAEAISRSEVAPESIRQAFQASRDAASKPLVLRLAIIVALGCIVGASFGSELVPGWLVGASALLGLLLPVGYCVSTGYRPNRSCEVPVIHEAPPNE